MHALGDLFADDADFIDVFGNWFKGRAAFEQVLAERHRSVFADSRFTRKDAAVRRVSADLAVVHAVIELDGATSPHGQPLAPALGVMSYVMAREGPQRWRILAFQNTAVMPPSANSPQQDDQHARSGGSGWAMLSAILTWRLPSKASRRHGRRRMRCPQQELSGTW